jgi:hypothetical protein
VDIRENNNQILKSIPYMIVFKDLNTKGPNVHNNGYISQNEIFKCIIFFKE